LVTKKNKETVVIEKNKEHTHKTNEDNNQEDGNMLEVIYDPVLNCYYDP
jgi:hypothetical protein